MRTTARKSNSIVRFTILFVALALGLLSARPAAPIVPDAAKATAHFDAKTATNAWLATVPAAAKAKSDAYFEGGYWLLLWDFLVTVVVMILLLQTRLSARMRDLAAHVTRIGWLQSFLYAIEFILVVSVVTFPWTVYESFFREHQYGLSNQTFASWFRDQFVALVVALIFGGLAVTVLMAAVRRFPRSWPIWGAVVAIVFSIIGIVIAPVFIAPLFNKYTSLQDTQLKGQILSLARQNGIPAKDVYQVDASRQSKRVSANVSGLLGTDRITLNDNLLNRCSADSILSVMGHEMGHYVLHHIYNGVLFSAIVIAIMFALLRWSLGWSLARWGAGWQIRGVDDVAVLPLAALILTTLSFLFTPIGNTFSRTQEYEADIFGLNTARQPDGEAEVDLLLGEYRKLDPAPLEEILFYDHPSGRTRIYAAMRWKAENLCFFDTSLSCPNPPKTIAESPSGPIPPSGTPLR